MRKFSPTILQIGRSLALLCEGKSTFEQFEMSPIIAHNLFDHRVQTGLIGELLGDMRQRIVIFANLFENRFLQEIERNIVDRGVFQGERSRLGPAATVGNRGRNANGVMTLIGNQIPQSYKKNGIVFLPPGFGFHQVLRQSAAKRMQHFIKKLDDIDSLIYREHCFIFKNHIVARIAPIPLI